MTKVTKVTSHGLSGPEWVLAVANSRRAERQAILSDSATAGRWFNTSLPACSQLLLGICGEVVIIEDQWLPVVPHKAVAEVSKMKNL